MRARTAAPLTDLSCAGGHTSTGHSRLLTADVLPVSRRALIASHVAGQQLCRSLTQLSGIAQATLAHAATATAAILATPALWCWWSAPSRGVCDALLQCLLGLH